MSERIEELQNTLFMPLAQLVKRTVGSSAGRDRHDGAFYLAEATLKLASAARVGRLLSLGTPLDAGLSKKLEGLLLPSTGHWMGLLRDTVEVLAQRPQAAQDPLAARAALVRSRKELSALPAFAKAAEAEHIVSAEVASQAGKTGVFGFFNLLVAYRNRVIGHSGQRVPAFYAEMGDLLLATLDQILRVPELFGELDLVVPRLELVSGVSASMRLRVLRGLATTSRAVDGTAWSPGDLYFVGADGYRAPLSPLVVFAESREQREHFGFLNGVDIKNKEVVKRVEYLDYATSSPLQGVDTLLPLTRLLARIRGAKVDANEVRATMTELALEQAEAPKDGSAGPTGASEVTPLVGSIVAGKYRVVREIGQGGMGAVYEVEHTTLRSRAAMKVLHTRLATKDEYIQRFAREAREAAQTRHPGIVQVTDHGRLDDGSAYLIMELLEGESLQSRIERSPLSIEDTVATGVAALDALEAAHQRGVVHRDIKPDNLFLPLGIGAPKVKVLDFGIAKSSDQAEKLTADGAILGTPSYIAPEQLGNSRNADARADVYAMGATLFACLTGRPPSDGADLRELLFNVSQGKIDRDPRKLRPDTPDWLAAVIERALRLSPASRFASAAEMRAALRTADGLEATQRPDEHLPKKKKPAWLTLATAATLGIIGILMVASRFGHKTDAPPASSNASPPNERASGSPASSSSAADAAPAALSSTAAPTRARDTAPAGMVFVRGGRFLLGLTPAEIGAADSAMCAEPTAPANCKEKLHTLLERSTPPQDVNVTDFYIDRTEVSRGGFVAWLNAAFAIKRFSYDAERAYVKDGEGRVLIAASAENRTEQPGASVRLGTNGDFTVEGDGEGPVVGVTWLGAWMYCDALDRRLPTEAQWELAARGPERAPYAWGDAPPSCDALVYGRLAAPTAGPCAPRNPGPEPVGQVDSTPGRGGEAIRGLGGNVREWVLDYVLESRGAAGPIVRYPPCAGASCTNYWVSQGGKPATADPGKDIGTAGELHAVRGCSFLDTPDRCLAAARGYNEAFIYEVNGRNSMNPHIGFRCAKRATPRGVIQ